MTSINYRVGKLLDRFGVSVRRDRTAFRELRAAPRFTPQEVDVAGARIRVGDGPTFVATYNEIFVDRIYAFETAADAPRIIDCGANFGISALFFKSVHPRARITAIEADPAICAMLADNMRRAGHGDVAVLNKAVSHDETPLTFHVEGADSGRVHALETAAGAQLIEAVTLDALIDGPVDLLKIDIEGAETAALLACTKLALVDKLFVEYHSFTDEAQSLADLLGLLRAAGFRCYVQTQFCAARPLEERQSYQGMDLQLNIFARRDGGAV